MSGPFYTEDHEWIIVTDAIGTVGITDYAQQQLGDVVFVDPPEVGRVLDKGEEVGVIESVKAASELYCPVSGEIVEVNEALADAPETLNQSPTEDGWIFKIKLSDPGELDGLMDAKRYQGFVEDLD